MNSHSALSAALDHRTLISIKMLVGTAIYAALLGLAALGFGWRRRSLWVAFWGALLAIGSGTYLAFVAFGIY
ncbi:MAG: hypothetical protein P8Y64_10310 [Gammaproteobacteria bacterium]|jgi:CHASE2 domain-containing sensor protein